MLFINFRKGDDENKAAWLDAELCAVFGPDRVFRSSRSIDLGHDYDPILWRAVENCSAMIAVIGDKWLTEFGSRLFQPDDVVRREIATVLAAGKPVIPVLEDSRFKLKASDLPSDLRELANCQYVKLTYRDPHVFPGLIERLISAAPELGIGVREGIRDLATWNREQSPLAGSELPTNVVLIGREASAEKLRSWLAGPPGNLVVQGQTTDEVAAFVAAVLDGHNPHHRAVLVTSEAGWEHAARIPPSFPAVVVGENVPVRQLQNARHVIIARDGFVRREDGAIVLPRLPRDQVRDAFRERGMPLHLADERAGLLRRSLRAVTRRLHPNEPRPAWTRPPDSAIAARLVLVSRWSTSNQADQAAIARITGTDYDDVVRFVTATAASGDPLVHRSGSRWQLADPYDALSELMAVVTETGLRQFGETTVEVLSEIDPVRSLPDFEAMSAGLKGIGRKWSGELREGLAHGLARLGDAGSIMVAGDAAENHAARVVVQLLRKASEDATCLLWRSLSDVLSLLAEACPRVFLDAVESGLQGDNPLLRGMFEDTGDQTSFRHSAHSGLQWALDALLWSKEHGTRAVLVLARLADVDPGGQWSNRPAQALVNALTQQPVTPVPLDRRAEIINQIRARHPLVGWRLLMDLTEPGGFLMYPERPRVRTDWVGAMQMSSDGVEEYWKEVYNAVLADLSAEPRRWAEFLPRMMWLPQTVRERFLIALEAIDLEDLGSGGTRNLWEAGRKVVNRELSGADADPHLSSPHIRRLSSFVDRIEPGSDSTRHAWLFGWRPNLPGIDSTDLESHRAAVDQLRREVVAEELDRQGVVGLACLAAVSARGDLVGWTLAQVEGDTVRDAVFSMLGDQFACGWVRCRAQEGGSRWAEEAVSALPDESAARTAFYLALPVELAHGLVAAEREDVRSRFWLQTPAFPFPAERPEEYLIEILGHDRPEAVVDALSVALHGPGDEWRPSSELVEATFDALLNFPHRLNSNTGYEVGSLLTYLYEVGHDVSAVARWEIAFANLFHDREPRALLERIAADPQAFVELHQFRFLPTEKLNPKAMPFFMTGQRLRCVPGQTEDRVDSSRLLEWVQHVRRALAELSMQPSGDRAIGSLISAGPDGEDGAWPVEAVRDILDLADGHYLRNGFALGLANNRNVSWRGVYDGGQQERRTAEQYKTWASKVERKWPYTAQVLRDHAEDLSSEGRYWDREAEDDHDE
ncbi:hypothetical protein ACFWN2_02790 [Lentzea sp. NPDC058436]|uniref:hypothetical protein n=1 Tax=Lentzea sp. NPDC058436 TaxID=3346499 RepID=UPI0036650653